jgi:mutator protein MutT
MAAIFSTARKWNDSAGFTKASGGKNQIDVAAALIFRAGKLPITQRHADSHLGGLWEFPGGKRESDETFEECLVREIRIGELFESVPHAYPEKTVHLKFFACWLTGGDPEPLDCAVFKRISATELDNYQFPAADIKLLEKLPDALESKLWLVGGETG